MPDGLPLPPRCPECNRDGPSCECGMSEEGIASLLEWRLRKSLELTGKNRIRWTTTEDKPCA